MKKASIIIASIVYFICASGLYVHAHFCGGELASVNYFALDLEHDCGCGPETPEDGCCKDILHFYKVDAHQQSALTKASFHLNIPAVDFITTLNTAIKDAPAHQEQVFQSHAPPPFLYAKAQKFIVNMVFRL